MKRALILAALLGGCTLGPKNLDPHAALPAPTAPETIAPVSGPAQAVAPLADSGNWWQAFQSAQLDALVDTALAHNNDIAVAEASLRQAQEQGRAAAGAALPQADLSYQAQHTRVSDSLAPAVTDATQYLYSLHTAQVTVSYGLDLFGATRSKIRSARAAADVQQHKRDAARATVVANLVAAVIQHAALVDQIAAAQTSIAVNRDILGALQKRQQLGEVGASDVATQQTALAAAEGTLPSLVRAEAHQRVVIASLIGAPADAALPDLPTLASLSLPAQLPLLLPSDLVVKRPDILAAKAQLEGAGADVGTAIAARLPSIQLSANAGGTAQVFGDMFRDGNPFWAVLGGVTQPLFHAGALRHQQRAAEAALDGAKAQYRATVLQAFGEVSDALTGLRTDADALDAATRASDASGRALGFVRRQLELGDVGTLALLNATAADAQARAQLVQARAARLSDTVALYQAVGSSVAAAK